MPRRCMSSRRLKFEQSVADALVAIVELCAWVLRGLCMVGLVWLAMVMVMSRS